MKSFIENETCAVFKGSANELSEFCDILISLLKLGIFEINQMVLNLVSTLLKKSFFGVFNALMLAQKLNYFTDSVNGLLLQALPAMIEEGGGGENEGSEGDNEESYGESDGLAQRHC